MSEATMGVVSIDAAVKDDRESIIQSNANAVPAVSPDADDAQAISVPTPISQQFGSFT